MFDGCFSSLLQGRRMLDRCRSSHPGGAECSTGAARACPGAAACSKSAARAHSREVRSFLVLEMAARKVHDSCSSVIGINFCSAVMHGFTLYIYIYILGSHMAPYGACEVAQSTARSKAQFEAERFRKGFRRNNKHDRKCFRRKQQICSKVLPKEKEACSSSDFERSVAFRRYKKQARAVISSAQRPKSKLEQ